MHTDSPKASVDPRLTLILVSVAIFVGAVDLTVVSAVLPKIMLDLQLSLDTELGRASWVVTGYLLAYTVSMIFVGRLSDLLGRRSVYMVCLVIFLVGSVQVATAPSLAWLIFGRVVQALGAGALVPVSMALVSDIFPPTARAAALGFIGAVDTAGWMVGHLYGGVLMRIFDDWRLLFWINLPIGLVALVLTWWALRHVPQRRSSGSFDWLGTLLISASLTALNLGLAAGAELGATDFYGERVGPPPYALPMVGLAIILLALFVWWERRARDPLLDLRLFRDRSAAAACLVNVLVGFALALAITNVPLFINTRLLLFEAHDPEVLRRAAWDTGWVLSALTLSMAVAALPGGFLAGRWGDRPVVMLGLALAGSGYLFMSGWNALSSYQIMVFQLIVTGLGLGLVIAPAADAVIRAATRDRRGGVAAIVIALRLVGMTIGVALLTMWGVQRQDALRRAGADDPLVWSDPALFLMNIASAVISETFSFGALAILLGLVVAAAMSGSIREH
ncbi:MFS transporter [Candidatus Viridilinea mediisalina]|uniref:MFS transporter n=1 Tax=Candidatus Viridilinea mediisalina TaxID=2024553 RepID=A0A2A6RP42_9CHLR|nr:MFS transporter [Candidatus Viridilinea mediisalina]PDW04610.1 MFS transporter [Candidatus Viridilinea mediisalina]